MLIASTVADGPGGWTRVIVRDAIESQITCTIVRSALGALLRGRPKGLSIDLGGVPRIAGCALEALRTSVGEAADDGVWVEIVNAPITVHRALADDPVLAPVLAAYAWRRDRSEPVPATMTVL